MPFRIFARLLRKSVSQREPQAMPSPEAPKSPMPETAQHCAKKKTSNPNSRPKSMVMYIAQFLNSVEHGHILVIDRAQFQFAPLTNN